MAQQFDFYFRLARRALGALTLAGLVHCTTRPKVTAYPKASAASPLANEASPADVTRALASDPPLPDEPCAGWRGLCPDVTTSQKEQQHDPH